MKRVALAALSFVAVLAWAEDDVREGPVGKEVFGYLWVPEVTQPSIYIADRAMIQADGRVLYAPFYRPSHDAEQFLSQVAEAMRLAYAGTSEKCTVAAFDKVMSDWRFDWDDHKALHALTACLPRLRAAGT